MIDLSPAQGLVILFSVLIVGLLSGFPLAMCLGGTGLLVGYLALGSRMFPAMYLSAFSSVSSHSLLAIPLFIFMGVMIEKSGVASRVFDTFLVIMGRTRGSLAVITVLTGAALAACVGIYSAPCVMLTVMALPGMMKHGYDKGLATGAITAAGCLGIIIPPSIQYIVYGPMAEISVGRMFMAGIIPGFLLAGLYIAYILVKCLVDPKAGPGLESSEIGVPISAKAKGFFVSILPIAVLIVGVLGSIFAGVATPTEAAAVGSVVAVLMSLAYRSFAFEHLRGALLSTLRISSMIIVIVYSAKIFMTTFMALGCGSVTEELILAAPFGKWGVFAVIMLIITFLGMFLDWLGIVLIVVPIITPIVASVGFDPLWFAMMVCFSLQVAYLSPPFCPAVYFVQGAAPPEYGITSATILRGTMPFLGLIILLLALCVAFPEIILWLPSQMIA